MFIAQYIFIIILSLCVVIKHAAETEEEEDFFHLEKLRCYEVTAVAVGRKLRAEETLLFLTKLTSLSHLNERKQKNCLNCNAQTYGKYCHICGQENLEPYESVWHLITHFFNDITHFDGKFFSTLGLLITKPGFLSSEYQRGRRSNYLNPVRMYVFTSFIFFFVFFSTVHIDEKMFNNPLSTTMIQSVAATDSAEYANIIAQVDSMDAPTFKEISRALNDGRSMSKKEFMNKVDSLHKGPEGYYAPEPMGVLKAMDSTRYKHLSDVIHDMDSSIFASFTKVVNSGRGMSRKTFDNYMDSARTRSSTIYGKKYKNRAEYDSIQTVAVKKDGWLKKSIVYKTFEIGEKVNKSDGKVMSSIFNIVLHYFPQMLFFSLPLFALFLKLIYFRRKDFYLVSHGIFAVQLYIFYFIGLLAIILLNELGDFMHWDWPDAIILIISLLMFFYEYKAMRNYYGQRRAKTFFKFILAAMGRLFIIVMLFTFFLLFSFLKI